MLILRLRLQETQHKRRLNNRGRAKTIAFDLNDGQPQSSRHTRLFGTIRTLVNFHTRDFRPERAKHEKSLQRMPRVCEGCDVFAKDAACLQNKPRVCEGWRISAKNAGCLRRMRRIREGCRVFAEDAAYPRRMPRVCEARRVFANHAPTHTRVSWTWETQGLSDITDHRSLAGADDQRLNHNDRCGPGPVQRMVIQLDRLAV